MKVAELLSDMPDMSLFYEDFAVDAAITMPDFDPRYAKVVGTMDGYEVWLTRFFGEHYNTFAFRDKEHLLAFIVVGSHPVDDAYPLVRMWVDPGQRGRGLTTALILFVTKKLKMRLVLTDDEPLTDDGWNWLTKAVERNKINAVKATTGQPLTAQDIRDDRQLRKTIRRHTDLSVIIERDSSKYPLFGSGGYRQLNEMVYVIDGPDGLE